MRDRAKVLVLDDNVIIGLGIQRALENNGFATVGPFVELQEAQLSAQAEQVDAALLDINLGNGTTSLPLAAEFIDHKIPFAFLTGYGNADGCPTEFSDVVRLIKPIPDAELVQALSALLGRGAES